ncbi:MAG TPA: hypothetical protein P5533_02355 [Candidatus Cloacimonadota bacterium]|nr:hypothetical protein [Candidatus Cloacimonadota bacterium]
MLYSGKAVEFSLHAPLKAIAAFFLVPVAVLLFDGGSAPLLPVCDAVFGVGIPVLIFLIAASRVRRTSVAFTFSSLMLIAYGMWRGYYFGDVLEQSFTDVMTMVRDQFPQYMNAALLQDTGAIWLAVMPAAWVVSQLLGLFAGFILFQRQAGAPLSLSRLQLPAYYNFLIIILLPLYLVAGQELVFYNVMISLAVLPMLQGVGVLIDFLSRILVNRFVLGVSLFIILINLSSYILLLLIGFADIWLNFRKLETGGSPA